MMRRTLVREPGAGAAGETLSGVRFSVGGEEGMAPIRSYNKPGGKTQALGSSSVGIPVDNGGDKGDDRVDEDEE